MLTLLNLNSVSSFKFECVPVTLFIFKISQNYIVDFLKIIRQKQASIVNQDFACKHIVNKSIQTYPHIIELFVCILNIFGCMFFKMSDFFRNMFNSKVIKINSIIIKQIQSNLMSTNIGIFIKIYYICPILYSLGKLSLE